jgi:hypothetical protein
VATGPAEWSTDHTAQQCVGNAPAPLSADRDEVGELVGGEIKDLSYGIRTRTATRTRRPSALAVSAHFASLSSA